MSTATPTRVFISYSHFDKAWRDRIASSLAAFGLEVLDDTLLRPGQDWAVELREMRERSSVAVLVITPQFLTSNTIRSQEIPHLMELSKLRGLRVIPVIAEDSSWQTFEPISKIQVFPEGGTPLFKGSEEQIRGDLERLGREIIRKAPQLDESTRNLSDIRTSNAQQPRLAQLLALTLSAQAGDRPSITAMASLIAPE